MRQLAPADYPLSLRQIPGVPRQLYLRGALPAPGIKTLAVVGSRALSAYGREACRTLIAGLQGYPVSVISGLALGADSEAHKAALAAGLHTVAVLGSGADDASIHPRAHVGLAHDILKTGGALVSEHAPGYKPYPHDFPERNRIVVGLADAVLIVEAGPQSGTLITARLTHEYNRDLLCIPHRIGDPHGFGAHLFLRLGATLVAEPSHILEALHIEARTPVIERTVRLDGAEQKIYELLAEPVSRDDLIRTSGLPASAVLTALVTLELKGVLKEEFGAWRRA
jgi:DNA processing protein